MGSDFKSLLLAQKRNVKIEPLFTYFNYLYGEIAKELGKKESILEVGAGAGTSSIFLNDFNILRTDLLPFDDMGIMGDVDASNLPFEDEYFDGVIGLDVLHHLEFPMTAISEMLRVSKAPKKIVLVEPYTSFLSYPIYKMFHHENTSIFRKPDFSKSLVEGKPEIGDQGIARAIFVNKHGKKTLKNLIGKDLIVEVRYINPFAFFSTGGINKPIKQMQSVTKAILKFERLIPKALNRLIASRVIITIKKK
jgi:SAM-dependent methyltransferase